MAYLYKLRKHIFILPTNRSIHYELRTVTVPPKQRCHSDRRTPITKILDFKSVYCGVFCEAEYLLDEGKTHVDGT